MGIISASKEPFSIVKENPRCPRCHRDLSDHIIEGKLYHKCSSCEGLWFDKGELGQIMQEKDWFRIESRHSKAAVSIAESGLECPRDGSMLKAIEYGHKPRRFGRYKDILDGKTLFLSHQ